MGCAGEIEVKGGLPDHDPVLAAKLVKEQHALVLDVRTPAEYASDHAPGAKNIPIDQLERRLGEVEAMTAGKKDHPLVVYCTRGVRAAQAKQILLRAGFTKVTNLGGLSDWLRP